MIRRETRRLPMLPLLLLAAMMVLATACSQAGTTTTTGANGDGGDGGAATTEAGGGEEGEELVIAVAELGSENFAPHRAGGGEQNLTYAVMERLIDVDPQTRERIPGLVTSWEPNDDFTQWTFTLREDVPFHPGPDGEDYGTLTAEDVKFTYSLYLRDDSLFARSDQYRALVDDNMDNFEIIDDHTFRLNMPAPNATVPALFGRQGITMSVTSQAYWDDVGEEAAAAHPIGTGPYRFESHEPGTSVHLRAVEDHWRKTPGFERLELRIIPDRAAQLAQIRAGEVDFAPIALDQVPQAESEGLQILSVPNVGVSSLYLGGHYPGSEHFDEDSPWIQADNPEQGLAVRQAMSMAIDREAIANDLLRGEATPVVGPVTYVPDYAATNPEWTGDGAQVPEYDPEGARELLAQGGYPDGFSIDQVSYEHGDFPFSVDISDAIESMMSEIGIDVNHRRITEAEYDEMREARSSQGTYWQYIQGFNDEPADRMAAFLPSDGGAEFFFEPYADYDFTPLATYIEQMEQEPDFDARMDIAQELGQELVDYVGPAIGIVAVNTQWVAGDDVGSWQNINGVAWLHNIEYIEPAG